MTELIRECYAEVGSKAGICKVESRTLAKRRRHEIGAAYQLLRHVPKHAIVDRLLAPPPDADALNAAYLQVTRKSVSVTRTHLIALPIPQLVWLFQESAATTEEDARELHDDWRYRGMKSLYLSRYTGDAPDLTDFVDELNEALHVVDGTGAVAGDATRLQFDEAEEVHLTAGAIIEVRYHYVAEVNYIDPADAEAKSVEDLRNGFVWLNPSSSWAAIAARDMEMRDRISHCFRATTGATLSNLRFSKDIIERLENKDRRRRIALVDQRSKITRRYTGKHLGTDPLAQQEIQQRWSQDDAPFNGFDVSVDDHTNMVLGYNSRHGKVFFSKDLTALQLRSWGPTKITEILAAVDDALRTRPKFKEQVISEYLRKLPAGARKAAAELVAAVAACKKGNVSEHELDRPVLKLCGELGRLANTALYVLRDDTEEIADLCCPGCQSERIELVRDRSGIKCGDCGDTLNLKRLPVVDGEPVRISDLNDAVQLLPTDELLKPVLEAAAAVTGQPLNIDEEFFCIQNRTLLYRRVTGNVVLAVDDIPELKSLFDKNVPTARRKSILAALEQFKEKCRHMNQTNCGQCVASRVGEKCYLRLFGLLDSTFTPQPHGCIEYGDYSRLVTVDGRRDQYLVVLMKKAPNSKGAITSSSAAGREILEQAIKYLQDGGTHIIGVSVPRLLHDNLKKLLIQLARWHGKKLVFFDDAGLARMISTVMSRKKMRLGNF